MTDEELLLHQLKNPPVMSMALNKDHLYRMMADHMKEAADRIEALTAERDEQIEWVKRLADMQIASEAKLAEVLNKWADAVEERDEALNQWDSARHSVDVLEKRVAFVEEERRKTFQALLKVTKIHDEVEDKLATCEKYWDAYAECDSIGTEAYREIEAKLAECEARLGKAVELLKEARQDLEGYVTHEWPKDEHPVYERKWEQDMELCRRVDATLAEIEGDKHV